MQVVYGFIYYFIWVMLAMTALLSVFYFKGIRKLFFGFVQKRASIFENPIVQLVFYVSFAIIFLIFAESVMVYYGLEAHLKLEKKGFSQIALEKLDTIDTKNHEGYIQLYKHYREYYMAERNILLTTSALMVYFCFSRLFATIKKYYELQEQIEEGSKPQALERGKSQIKDKSV